MVENYTNAFLISFGWLVFIGLMAIWAHLGFLAAVFIGVLADRVIVLEARRHRARRRT